MKLKTKLMLSCLVAGIVPVVIMALASSYFSDKIYRALTDDALVNYRKAISHLVALRAADVDYKFRQLQASPSAVSLAAGANPPAAGADALAASSNPSAAGADTLAVDAFPALLASIPYIDFAAVFDKAGNQVFAWAGGASPPELKPESLKPRRLPRVRFSKPPCRVR